MKCQKARKQIKACLDKELSGRKQERLKQHLEICPECSKEADLLSGVWGLLSELPQEKEIPVNVIPEVLHRVSMYEERSFVRKVAGWITDFQGSFATATVLAMIVCFIAGFGIAIVQPVGSLNEDSVEDPLYLDIFADAPASSVSEAYLTLIIGGEDEIS